MKALLSALLLPAIAWGQSITVDLTHGAHTSGLTKRQARQVWAAAVKRVRAETGVRLRLATWRTVPMHPVEVTDHLTGMFSRFPFEPGVSEVSLVLAPRYRYDGLEWSAGLAAICGRAAVTYSGAPRHGKGRALDQAVNALTHELGHVLGAQDRTDGSVMDRNVLGLTGRPGFVADSVNEVGTCQARRRGE